MDPEVVVRLADAYRMTSQVEIHRRRLDLTEEMNNHRIAAATHDGTARITRSVAPNGTVPPANASAAARPGSCWPSW